MKRLKNETDLAIAQIRAAVLIEGGELGAVEPYFPRRGLVETGEQGKQRGFAGARRSDDRGRVTLWHADRHGIEDGQLTLGAANLFRQILGS